MKGLRISEERLAQLPPSMTGRALGKPRAPRKPRAAVSDEPPPLAALPVKKGGKQAMQALGRLPAGVMNKTEAAYAEYLESRLRAGEVVWYRFEPMRLLLAPKTTYAPDFLVQLASGYLEVHEVKGFWEDDARVKIKVAAAMFPIYKFIAVQKGKEGEAWTFEGF